jgi:hypothetical protein
MMASDQIVQAWNVDFNPCPCVQDLKMNHLDVITFHLKSMMWPPRMGIIDLLKFCNALHKFLKCACLRTVASNMKSKATFISRRHAQKGLMYDSVESVLSFEYLALSPVEMRSMTHCLFDLHLIISFVEAMIEAMVDLQDSDDLGPATLNAYMESTLKTSQSCMAKFLSSAEMCCLPIKLDLKRKLICGTDHTLDEIEASLKVCLEQLKAFSAKFVHVLQPRK